MPKRFKAFIVFTGIDGSGKTFHATSLSRELKKIGIPNVYLKPRDVSLVPSFIGKWLERHPHLSPRNITISSEVNRSNSKSILKALCLTIPFLTYALIIYFVWIRLFRSKQVVICDRYFFDWFYNLLGDASIALLYLLPKPDVVFILDVPVKVALRRMHDSFDKKLSEEYYESLRAWLLVIGKRLGFFVIDSAESIEKVKNRILDYTLNILSNDN